MVGSKVTKLNSAMHTAGIYSDMTVDGPEIGTLVVIVDRAKNLPNRRSMGKQDPYCACRLGKEANKTKTDKRGGQVPRWDQELRFTVHDSPDYYNLKVSVFNDDKKTELIGETWVKLEEVIKPGGGQSDVWHNLNCKGKYAGEVRLEMTYYDSRPKPEEPVVETPREGSGSREVRRRPLPSNPGSNSASPAEYPRPPASGPREYGTPPRPNQPGSRSSGNTPSSQRRTMHNNQQPQPAEHRKPVSSERFYAETPDDPFIQQPMDQYNQQPVDQYNQQHMDQNNQQPPEQYNHQRSYSGYDVPLSEAPYSDYSYQEPPPIELPELPPMSSSRRPAPPSAYEPSNYNPQQQHAPHELHHSHSAPSVPMQPQEHHITPQRQSVHHAQSDNYMHHGQPMHASYEEVPETTYDPYSNQQQQQQQQQQYQSPPASRFLEQGTPHPSPAFNGYDEFDRPNGYHSSPVNKPNEYAPSPVAQWSQSPSNVHELPPPPPVHRDSVSNAVQRHRRSISREYQAGFAPAPLNIGAAREAQNQIIYQEPQQDYDQQSYRSPSSDHGGRRNTDPSWSSPNEVQPYRPRALSGEAMQQRPAPYDDPYTLPPSHPDYHSPTTSSPPQRIPQERKRSRSRQKDAYAPVASSPLAIESPQTQFHTPTRATQFYRPQPVVAKPLQTPPRPAFSTHHHSTSEPYLPPVNYQTPPAQHPLSQQVPAGSDSSPNAYAGSTQPTPPQSNPSAIGSAMHSDPRTRQPRPQNRSTPTMRKSVSPRPPQSERPKSAIFGPDCFDQFNPALRSTSSLINNPATSGPNTPGESSRPGSQRESPYTQDGKIIDWHGKEIDPSDRLPETSWAPEPEPKGPIKEKTQRERVGLTGARGPGRSPRESFSGTSRYTRPGSSAGASPMKAASASSTPRDSPTSTSVVASNGGGMIRARLKKARPHSVAAAIPQESQGVNQPFRDIPKPITMGSGGYGAVSPTTHGSSSLVRNRGSFDANSAPYNGSPNNYGNVGNFGGSAGYSGSPAGLAGYNGRGTGGPPPIPAKVPLNAGYGQGEGQGDMSALSQEMMNIDIGTGRGRVAGRRMLGFR